jgi:DivIVA domain-containing protein
MSFNPEDVAGVEFGTSPIGRRGYAKAEVDEFVSRIAKTFAEQDDLTAAEVHHVTFAKPLIGKRGYDEREVDEFLDEVENELVSRSGIRPHPVPGARLQGQATDERAVPGVMPVEHFQDR